MTVLGLSAVLANLTRYGVQIIEATDDGLDDAAKKVRDAWVANIQSEGLVDTGRYRDSISIGEQDGEHVVYTDVDYARFLEFGTSRTPAHPAAERAADESHDDVLNAVASKVGGVL